MISLRTILQEIGAEGSTYYDAWVRPDAEQLRLEFRVEHELKALNVFQDVTQFLEAARLAKPERITASKDRAIQYRSRTRNKQELISLLRGYRSWGKYRSEEKVERMYDRFRTNAPMDMPLVLEWPNGRRRVFAGNTRMDIARHLDIDPTVLIIKIPE